GNVELAGRHHAGSTVDRYGEPGPVASGHWIDRPGIRAHGECLPGGCREKQSGRMREPALHDKAVEEPAPRGKRCIEARVCRGEESLHPAADDVAGLAVEIE